MAGSENTSILEFAFNRYRRLDINKGILFLYKLLFIFLGLQQARTHFNVHILMLGILHTDMPSGKEPG